MMISHKNIRGVYEIVLIMKQRELTARWDTQGKLYLPPFYINKYIALLDLYYVNSRPFINCLHNLCRELIHLLNFHATFIISSNPFYVIWGYSISYIFQLRLEIFFSTILNLCKTCENLKNVKNKNLNGCSCSRF